MLKIYGNPISSRVQKILFVCSYTNTDYELIMMDLQKGEHKAPEFLKKNPIGKVPFIEDGAFGLSESTAITKYIAKKAGGALYADTLQEQAIIDQWCDFIALHIDAHTSSLGFNKLIAPMLGAPIDEMALKEKPEFLKRFFKVLENQLTTYNYVARDTLSIADICLLSAIDGLESIDIDITPYPKLEAWRENMRSQDFYKNCKK